MSGVAAELQLGAAGLCADRRGLDSDLASVAARDLGRERRIRLDRNRSRSEREERLRHLTSVGADVEHERAGFTNWR